MLQRMWKRNTIFSVLFVLSFVLSFVLLYYGMTLVTQATLIQSHREEQQYQFRMTYRFETENRIELLEYSLPKIEQGILLTEGDVAIGKSIVDSYAATIVLKQTEAFKESLDWGHYPTEDELRQYACVVIGQGFSNDTFTDGEHTYILLNGEKFLVTGSLSPNTFSSNDTRVWIFFGKLSEQFCAEWCYGSLVWQSNQEVTDESFQAINDWIAQWYDKEPEIEAESGDVWDDESGHAYRIIKQAYDIMMYILLAFCLMNCCALAYVWGKQHTYEWMVRLVFGFGRLRIFGHIVVQILTYELISLVIAGIGILLHQCIKGSFYELIQSLSFGTGFLILGMIVFTVVISVVPMVWVLQISPAKELKEIPQ